MIPKQIQSLEYKVDKEKLKAYLKGVGKIPIIKEELILKAYDMTEVTKVLYDTEEIIILYSKDETGVFISIFNKVQESLQVTFPLSALGLTGDFTAYCVLTAQDLCVLNGEMNLQLPEAGVLLIKLMPYER